MDIEMFFIQSTFTIAFNKIPSKYQAISVSKISTGQLCL